MPQQPLALEIGIQYGGGGEGRVISELHKFLPAAGFRVRGAVAAPDDVEQLTGGDFISFAPESAPKIARFRRARAETIRILREDKPAIVASHFALYALPAMDRLGSAPRVTHFHGPWGAESAQDGAGVLASSARVFAEKTVYRRADRVVVLSKAFAELARSRYNIDPNRIRIVPGSVDVERFAIAADPASARLRLGLPGDRPILVAVRRLVARMGLSDLILAIKRVKESIPDVLLCIAGRGHLRSDLEQQIKDLDLSCNVRMLGFVPDEDLPYLYRAADLNVVPSLALEGFGLVAAEALAAGVPSLVTRVGGLPEVVESLSSNLILPSSEPQQLAESLKDALLGRLELPSRDACAAYIATNFNSKLMAERTAAVYGELL